MRATRFGSSCIFGGLILGFALSASTALAETPPTIYMNRNYEDVPMAPYPGVVVATLKLPVGSYMMWAKFRYRNMNPPGSAEQSPGCVFSPPGGGIGGLDGSQQNVAGGGELTGQVDGVLMDFFQRNVPSDNAVVDVVCFGPADGSVHIINTQFIAMPATLKFLP